MKPERSNRFLKCTTVKAIWDMIQQLYFKIEDDLRIVDLTTRAMELLQGQKDDLEYSDEL